MGLDYKRTQAKKTVLQTVQGEAFQRAFPYGATVGEVGYLLQISSSQVSESLGYLRVAGLVVRDKNGRHMAANSTTADQPLIRRFLTPEEVERLRAGVPTAGVLTADQQQRLELFRAVFIQKEDAAQ